MAAAGKCERREIALKNIGVMGTVNSDTLSMCVHRLADTVARRQQVKTSENGK